MESATVRVRPLRYAFVVEPRDKFSLQRIFEVNSSLWGGVFNFIIPLFKQVPDRYRDKYFKTPPAKAILKGLVEAFQKHRKFKISRHMTCRENPQGSVWCSRAAVVETVAELGLSWPIKTTAEVAVWRMCSALSSD